MVSATQDNTDHVQITWQAPEGASYYRVYRNTENNPATATALRAGWGSRTELSDYPPEVGRQYYYWVRAAVTSNGERPSDFSTPVAIGYVPYPPAPVVDMTGYGASKGTYTDRVRITWNPVLYPKGIYYYRVYRSSVNDDARTAVPVSGWLSGTTGYDDFTAVPGTLYWYWVSSALTDTGERESLWQYCSGCVDSGWRQLLPPSVLNASQGTYADRIRVTWQPPAGAPRSTCYKVYRNSVNNVSTAELVSPVIDGTSFDDNDTKLAVNTVYYYWVTSVADPAGSRESPRSTIYYTGGWKAATAPAGVTASDGDFNDRVRIYWSSVPGCSYYKLIRNTSDDPRQHRWLCTGARRQAMKI